MYFVQQVDERITINTMDFQNINLQTALKTVNTVANGNVNSDLSPYKL